MIVKTPGSQMGSPAAAEEGGELDRQKKNSPKGTFDLKRA